MSVFVELSRNIFYKIENNALPFFFVWVEKVSWMKKKTFFWLKLTSTSSVANEMSSFCFYVHVIKNSNFL